MTEVNKLNDHQIRMIRALRAIAKSDLVSDYVWQDALITIIKGLKLK